MDSGEIDNALFDGLAGVRRAAKGLDRAAVEFAKICDTETQSVDQRQAIYTTREALKSVKKLVDEMQGDWGCWSEERYKALAELCFEAMSKLRGSEAALAAAARLN